MPDMFEVCLTVKGTNVALWFWREYPNLVATCTTPTYKQKTAPECSKRYTLTGVISHHELTMIPNDLEMIGAAFEDMRFGPVR